MVQLSQRVYSLRIFGPRVLNSALGFLVISHEVPGFVGRRVWASAANSAVAWV